MGSSEPQLTALIADITTLEVDVIVNAANEGLLAGGGVCGAIFRAAGPKLVDACQKLAPCPTGEARITPGFLLPAKYIIHAVGPVWHAGEESEKDLLAGAYKSALRLAAKHAARASHSQPSARGYLVSRFSRPRILLSKPSGSTWPVEAQS